jgi:PAS domain S-box-containing protein
MTIFDLLIVFLSGWTIIFYIRNADKFRVANAQLGARSILLGICITGIYYLSDFVTMHIFPMFMPTMKAMSYMNYLHHNVSWFVIAFSVAFIVLGFLYVTRCAFLSREKVGATLAELERRDAELMAQNEHFKAALDNMSQGLCMFDGKQHLIVCNERYASMYGLSPEQVKPGTAVRQILESRVANGVCEVSPEEYVEERLNWIKEMAATKRIDELSDGRIIEVTNQPMSGGGWVATHEDISELKKVEEELRTSEKLFRDFVNNSPSSISMKGLDRTYLLVNAKYSEFFGRSANDVIGEKPHNLFNKDLVDSNLSHDNAVLEAGCAVELEEEVQVKGETKTLLTVKFPVTDDSGRVMGIGAIATDITDRKIVEQELADHRDHLQELVDQATGDLKIKAEELRRALAKEKELNELQRRFVSMASHEFRTPLAIIDATAQRMKNQVDKNRLTPDNAIQRVKKIRDAVKRMTRLMESTLAAASMEEGKISFEIVPCDIGKIISEVCARQQDIAHTHVITYEGSDLPESIQADTGALEQVLANLLSNAVKYAPDAPNIEVKTRREGHQVVISVRDHGIGIDTEDLHRIGERFFRAKTSTGIVGTGIGLNLVRTLVEMHGGTMSLDSKKGEGSTFTVHLPIAGPDKLEQPEASVA